MRIRLLRHAPTAGNLKKHYLGSSNQPLSAKGIAQTEQIEPDTAVSRAYTSGLERTRHTARILFPQAEIVPIHALDEMDFGEFEGKSAADLADSAAYRMWVEGNCEGTCPGGENVASFSKRCRQAFVDVLTAEQKSDEVVFVLHGGTIMAILSALASPERTFYEWSAPHLGGYIFSCEGELTGRPLHLIRTVKPPDSSQIETGRY